MGKAMTVEDPMDGLRRLLESWAVWIKQGRPGPGGYRCTLGDLRAGGLPIAPMADDVALRVDVAYGQLRAHDARLAWAVELWYVHRISSYQKLGKVMRIERARARYEARELILNAEHWLAGRLADVLSRA